LLEKREEKLKHTTGYEIAQGVLSFVVLISLVFAGTFTLEYYNLVDAMDITPWGMTYVPVIFNTAWVIFALAVVAKLWGGWVQNKFWIKADWADKFYSVGSRIDPRRR
jgi:magnesium-transporting ATPase (P-type)|tara:strand:- start:403 stop:726 length:324 start_codon:yes stop_codon:yes gene_type:complete